MHSPGSWGGSWQGTLPGPAAARTPTTYSRDTQDICASVCVLQLVSTGTIPLTSAKSYRVVGTDDLTPVIAHHFLSPNAVLYSTIPVTLDIAPACWESPALLAHEYNRMDLHLYIHSSGAPHIKHKAQLNHAEFTAIVSIK